MCIYVDKCIEACLEKGTDLNVKALVLDVTKTFEVSKKSILDRVKDLCDLNGYDYDGEIIYFESK
ncbi:MAG: hypothetical protein ACE5ES_01010 [Candidatus Nanoarchaeia archaeon]